MKPLRQDPKPMQQAPQPQRLRQQPILIEEEQYSDEEEGEYVMPHQHRPQQGLGTPFSAEFEELPWPPRFNPIILPQFDGDSDPKISSSSTKRPSKHSEAARHAKLKHLSSRLRVSFSIGTPTSQVAISTHGTSSEESSPPPSERRSLKKSTHVTSTT